MWDVSSQAEHEDAYTPLLEALQLQINPENDTDAMDISPTDSAAEKQQWRQSIREVVQALTQPYEVSWMDDDDSLSDAQYISRALNEVDSRFERSDRFSSPMLSSQWFTLFSDDSTTPPLLRVLISPGNLHDFHVPLHATLMSHVHLLLAVLPSCRSPRVCASLYRY